MLHHYVIVRDDLPRGVLAAQLIHAAGESSDRVPSGTHAVCLAVKDELELLELERRLCERDVPHTAIREPDAPWHGALMAIGIEPMARTQPMRRIFARLSLLKEKNND